MSARKIRENNTTPPPTQVKIKPTQFSRNMYLVSPPLVQAMHDIRTPPPVYS